MNLEKPAEKAQSEDRDPQRERPPAVCPAGSPPRRDYTRGEVLLANLPYAAMIVLGAATLGTSLRNGPWAMAAALVYLLCGLGGALWIMVRVCPCCGFFGTRGCPCGYGMLAARIATQGDRQCFAERFRRHIPVLVPLWLVPLAAGLIALSRSFTWGLLAWTAAFVLDAFVLLPLLAQRHSCGECPQRATCPWMAERRRR